MKLRLTFISAVVAIMAMMATVPSGIADAQGQSLAGQEGGRITSKGSWIPDGVEEMAGLKLGPFVRLRGGGILTVEVNRSLISTDEGKTWKEYEIFASPDKFSIRPERALIRTRSGVIILAFANDKERANWNWQADIHDSPGAILPTYAVRSLDGGKTWEAPQKLHDDWTGAIRDIKETRDGNVVFTSMMMQHHPGHHSVVTYTTKNDGKDWLRSNVIDLGGIGHHGGVTEATLEQLKTGRLWLLMRTNWGKFWEAFSDDEGLTWKNFNPTTIAASSAPGLLKRLESGRLVLVWNRPFPEGKDTYPLRGGDGQWSEVPASNHREELSIMFSDDDGKTWTRPVVIARCTEEMQGKGLVGGGRDLSYPYVFEAKPGVLWISIWRGELRIKLKETDFACQTGSKPARRSTDGDGKAVLLRIEPGANNPRNSEGDFIELADGRLMFVYTRFTGNSANDHAAAYLAGIYSSDGGKSWSDPEVIIEKEGDMNVMSVSLLRLKDGRIALFYLRKDSRSDCIPMIRISADEAKTWSEAIPCIKDKRGYFVLNNDRVIQLSTGRLLVPVSRHQTPGSKWSGRGTLSCYFSDDNGTTWQSGMAVGNPDSVITQEPGVVELKDGRVLMFIRTNAGVQYQSFSDDKGVSWTEAKPADISSPLSPASIKRIPSTGDLLLIWNNNGGENAALAGKRTPFNSAISKDEGRTWTNVRTIEDDPDGWYCYTAIHFAGDHVLLGHCAGNRPLGTGLSVTNISRLDLKWIYDKGEK